MDGVRRKVTRGTVPPMKVKRRIFAGTKSALATSFKDYHLLNLSLRWCQLR
jgi:hypothetical protein